MNAPLPAASRPRSTPLSVQLSNSRLPTAGPRVRPPSVPTMPSPMTMTSRRRIPLRNSSWRPAPASAASLGSSAAWTAWNRRIGIRATKMPVMKRARASCCAPVWQRTVARQRAAGDERGEVADDGGEQTGEQEPLTVEQRVDDRVREDDGQERGARREHAPEHGRPLHERAPTDAPHAPVGQGPGDLLL